MKCHYIYDKKLGKILIPGCISVSISNDMSRCTCINEITFNQFEKQRYNKILSEKQSYINELEKEIARLNRILKRIN